MKERVKYKAYYLGQPTCRYPLNHLFASGMNTSLGRQQNLTLSLLLATFAMFMKTYANSLDLDQPQCFVMIQTV